MSIDIQKINKKFADTQILHDINLSISAGEMLAILGPSGSGKTTLLRIIAGLEQQDSGTILFSGRDVSHLPAAKRHVGFVFQHYALFRHMTVFDNVAFALSVLPAKQRLPSAVIKQRVNDLLEMVHLHNYAHRYPAHLSGGQKQRVALARSLAAKPEILLLDEPFGALDAKVRKELRRWLRELHEELSFTSVFVTHDQDEAMEVASQVIVMSQGRIEQQSAPQQVWQAPKSRFVMEFIGEMNQLNGHIVGPFLQLAGHQWPLNDCELEAGDGPVDILLRPWEVQISDTFSIHTPLAVRIVDILPRGHYWQLTAQAEGQSLSLMTVYYSANHAPQRGSIMYAGFRGGRAYQGNTLLRDAVF